MTAKVLMPVRKLNLVAPLVDPSTTAMRTTDTAAHDARAASGATPDLFGFDDLESLRDGGVDSATVALTPGTRTSTTATRTTTTRATKAGLEPSADPDLFERLVQAYIDCRRTKRNTPNALAFEAWAERYLCDLHHELASGAYRPGRSICFVVTRPRPREVWAAEFRDRVVHHLLYAYIAPRFHASFTADTCACIPGRGTLYAAHRLEHQVRSITRNWQRPAYYLKLDFANFFVSIDKHVLLAQLARRVHEPWWLRLAETILMHDPRSNVELRGQPSELRRVPAHKSLYNALPDTGLPIGNLSSQFFANVLLDDLDQFIKHRLRAPHYVRYVDDFVLLHESAAWLNDAHRQITQFATQRLHLQLNERKTILQPVARGVDFVGHVIQPWHRTTRRRTVANAVQRIRTVPAEQLLEVANSYFGLLGQASHSHADRARLANAVLDRGHSVSAALTKTYRRKARA